MAKQSGLHQIKGKVGEFSYYKQTGVSGGLIRGINQGLSARVKTGAEYANTRLNNQEFGAACDVAGLLGKCVVPKFRPMILPFSQSKMAAEVLKVARENTANWGQRVVTGSDTERLCAILSSMSKLDANDFVVIGITRTAADELTLEGVSTPAQASMMASLGITNLTVTSTVYGLQTGQWVPLAHMMTTGFVDDKGTADVFANLPITSGAQILHEESLVFEPMVPAPNHSGHLILVTVVLPSRTINNDTHILQEYCSFIAQPIPEYVP